MCGQKLSQKAGHLFDAPHLREGLAGYKEGCHWDSDHIRSMAILPLVIYARDKNGEETEAAGNKRAQVYIPSISTKPNPLVHEGSLLLIPCERGVRVPMCLARVEAV